eukprot:gnl/TRDRNA2_/TRDRNA2_151959_c0_seq1.p1 gnl/TRDRNA2_/TRDRNA2_151959_c0~~gnl/TRDRNA2_/TRDRNA2_151959_c0_seq1.p1  ORF type:complete len:213 (+),score=24.01 gnl/TRDRNA2_/TRDRNA2_151959_c0_seq1:212-850(+)
MPTKTSSCSPPKNPDMFHEQSNKVECYQKALSLAPAYLNGWNNLGIGGGGVVNGKKYSKPECFQQAVSLDPANEKASVAWLNLGSTGGIVNGKHYSRVECIQNAIELTASNFNAWYNLAILGGGIVNGQHCDQQTCLRRAYQCASAEQKKLFKFHMPEPDDDSDSTDYSGADGQRQCMWMWLLGICLFSAGTFAATCSSGCRLLTAERLTSQ